MSMSLREQLLQAGFGKKKQAPKAQQPQRQDEQRSRDEARRKEQERVAQAQAAKAAREQEQQRRRQEEADRKARWAQIRQLIEQHRLPKVESDEYFNFISRGKVRRLAVDAQLRERIVSGELVIVRCEGRHDVVPRDIAENIRACDTRAVITLQDATGSPTPAEDDPYKDYVVPDDLRW
jgi:uncharacterized protein YaiL (DUF2058 family)